MCTRTVALNKCVYVWMCRIHFFRLNSNNILRFIQTPNLTLCIFATHNSWRQNQTYTLTKCQIYITVLNVLRAELVRCYFFSFVFHFLCAIFGVDEQVLYVITFYYHQICTGMNCIFCAENNKNNII